MSIFSAMRTSSSGMTAERFRMDVISQNIAGANTIQTPTKDAYRRKEVVLSAEREGVRVSQIVTDPTPLQIIFDPTNPYADAQGNVRMSNVQPVIEMVNMLGASRAYEANIAAFNSARSMAKAALNIGNI
ncbi:MAG: flagellar basal body rod protein FlgC [Chthonomonas sp.]|nr:flagellar basal body rod protein FlgC [Chthonomonas sp.]